MREILFRGKKTYDQEWIEGHYCRYETTQIGGGVNEMHRIVPYFASALYGFEVDPSTVGQYTGLTDKNGQKIFEGDILFCVHTIGMGYREFRGKVVYKAPKFFMDCGNVVLLIDYDNGKSDLTIIGNIYDNPDLLEVTT